MDTYPGPPCKQCGGTEWKKIAMPVFRVEECTACRANRTTTDSRAGADHPPGSFVYLVVEAWGGLEYGDVVAVFSNQGAAEREAERRHTPSRASIRYLVKRYEVLGDQAQ